MSQNDDKIRCFYILEFFKRLFARPAPKTQEQWDIACHCYFPTGIFSYNKWKFKEIGRLSEAEHVSKIYYDPSLFFICIRCLFDKAIKSSKSCYIAVKRLSINGASERQTKNIKNEIECLKKIRAEFNENNIIRLYGVEVKDSEYYLYMEWMDFSMHDLLIKGIRSIMIKKTFTNDISKELKKLLSLILVEIIDALCILCKYNINHRDVKPANILLNYVGHVKLADFGEARSEYTNTKGGTCNYRPPEAYNLKLNENLENRQKYDVYSLGVICLEYLCRIHPFCGTNPYAYITGIDEESPVYHPDMFSPYIESGELIKWSDADSVFIKNNIVENSLTKEFLSKTLQHVETRVSPKELKEIELYKFYKQRNIQNEISTILYDLQLQSDPDLILTSYNKNIRKFLQTSIVFVLLFIVVDLKIIFTPDFVLSECENSSGRCLHNDEICNRSHQMWMPYFSCAPRDPDYKCCYDVSLMSSIDRPQLSNDCGCDYSENLNTTDCIENYPNGTKNLQKFVQKKFSYLIKIYDDCDTNSWYTLKEKRVVGIFINETLKIKERIHVEQLIFNYLVKLAVLCEVGIEEIVYWSMTDGLNETTHLWNEKFSYVWKEDIGHMYHQRLERKLFIVDQNHSNSIIVTLNHCGAKKFGSNLIIV